MSNIPDDLKYTADHEWVRVNNDGTLTIGVSDYAQERLGDLVFVEIPEVGRTIDGGESCAVVESVKSASDINCPVAGEVIEVNEALADTPELVNEDPYGEGWLFRVSSSESLDNLMDADAYSAHISEDDD